MLHNTIKNLKQLSVNFGPQHPSAHGVLRMSLLLNCERIIKCDPHIGLLHRGTESLIASKPNLLSLPYFDRLDYVSMLTQEHAYTIAIENINKYLHQNIKIQQNRTVMDEISRILNHLLAIACHALDVGSMSIIFWAFEERENFMEVYENISGARMHVAYTKPIFFNKLIGYGSLNNIINNICNLPITIGEITSVLNTNKIWKSRLKNIGVLTKSDLFENSISGVMLRSIGIKNDLRLLNKTTYSFYKFINFFGYSTKNGDSLDRYNIRIYEIIESTNIINSIILNLINVYDKKKMYTMESVIDEFKVWSGIYLNRSGSHTACVESSKGIFCVNVLLNRMSTPLYCKIRSPSYNHLFLLKSLARGLQLADLVTLIGTIDIVFGEIDR